MKNFVCIAGCEIKKLAKKFVAWAEQIGIKVMRSAPILTLNAIVINSLLTEEYQAFLSVSVSGVHTENGSFSKRAVFKFYAFSLAFLKSSVFTAAQCERKAKTDKFCSVFKRSSENLISVLNHLQAVILLHTGKSESPRNYIFSFSCCRY